MEYSKKYIVNEAHLDESGLVNSSYYPFYMELCRVDYLKDQLGFDFAHEASRDIYMKVFEYDIKSFGKLGKGDSFTVSCCVFVGNADKQNFNFKQRITKNNRIIAMGTFSVNCVMVSKHKPGCGEM